ncbi:MAG: hypothetical protein K6E56_06910 [Lachnospiraceae bacterium]|nr:hypothetical protein [Lachnospiraceae bacterium]
MGEHFEDEDSLEFLPLFLEFKGGHEKMRAIISNIAEALVLAVTSVTLVAWFFGIDICFIKGARLVAGLIILGILYYIIISLYSALTFDTHTCK